MKRFNHVCNLPNIIKVIELRRMRWVGHAARIVKTSNSYKNLFGKLGGKRALGRSRHRCKNIVVDLGVTEWEGVD
jgi:hypothetical protein